MLDAFVRMLQLEILQLSSSRIQQPSPPGRGSRRRFSRFPITARVMVIPLDSGGESFWSTSRDMGGGGVFICARAAIAPRRELLLKIVHRKITLCVKAEVVHRIGGVGFGCRFVDVSPAASTSIGRLLGLADCERP